MASNNQTLEQLRTNIEVYKQKVASLENDKNQLVSEKTNLENQLSAKNSELQGKQNEIKI